MLPFPNSADALVVRTDYSNQSAWTVVRDLIRAPADDGRHTFYAYVECLDHERFRNLSPEDLLACVPEEFAHSFLIIADAIAMEGPEYPVLVMDLLSERGRTFRALPTQIQSVENNLSIANKDFREFADSVDADGIFRGFRDP